MLVSKAQKTDCSLSDNLKQACCFVQYFLLKAEGSFIKMTRIICFVKQKNVFFNDQLLPWYQFLI
jgi:hypothetical protein